MEADRETIIKGLIAWVDNWDRTSFVNTYSKIFIASSDRRLSNQEKVDWFENIIEEFFKREDSKSSTLNAITLAFHEGCPLADEIGSNVQSYRKSEVCSAIGNVFAHYFRTIASYAARQGLRVRWSCKEDLMKDFT